MLVVSGGLDIVAEARVTGIVKLQGALLRPQRREIEIVIHDHGGLIPLHRA